MDELCPYCQDPKRFDLLPAIPMVVRVIYEKGVYQQLSKPIKLRAHLSRHPLRDQKDFKIQCTAL